LLCLLVITALGNYIDDARRVVECLLWMIALEKPDGTPLALG
jgi:hypothetical protein